MCKKYDASLELVITDKRTGKKANDYFVIHIAQFNSYDEQRTIDNLLFLDFELVNPFDNLDMQEAMSEFIGLRTYYDTFSSNDFVDYPLLPRCE
jgi:hypothetical protein